MSLSVQVVGIIPGADPQFQKDRAAWMACREAGVTPPSELGERLRLDVDSRRNPDPGGVVLEEHELGAAVSGEAFQEVGEGGLEIDLRQLPKGVKILRINVS